MISVKKLIVGPMSTNCYLVSDNDSIVIIDSGGDAEYIEEVIQDTGSKVAAIIATHGHYDHILSVFALKLAFNCPFYMSSEDKFLLSRMQRSAKYYNAITADPPPKFDKEIEGRTNISKYLNFDVIKTPGHTPGSVCLHLKSEKMLFCGDLLFDNGMIGRCDHTYSSSSDMSNSIDNILKIDPTTKVYSGHGDEFSIETFRKSYIMKSQDNG